MTHHFGRLVRDRSGDVVTEHFSFVAVHAFFEAKGGGSHVQHGLRGDRLGRVISSLSFSVALLLAAKF